MTEEDIIPNAIRGSSLDEPLLKLHLEYKKAESEMAEWRKASGFVCPESCGTCCENFEPDVLPVEALYLASWIYHGKRIQSFAKESQKRGCPFYDAGSRARCSVYPARPLICRLFAWTGSRNKTGEVEFIHCRHSPNLEKRKFSQSELVETFGCIPPAMGDLGARIVSIQPHEAGTRMRLREALPSALQKILLLSSLGGGKTLGSADEDDDSPNDSIAS